MASGSQNMTTDKARQAFYLEAPHQYGFYTDEYGNFICKNDDPESVTYWRLDNNAKTISSRYYWETGDLHLYGKLGIGYDPTTSGNTYKLYVNGTSYFTDTVSFAQGLKTGSRASNGSGSGIEIGTDGGIEIFHTSTPFIDFHYQASTADYSVRLICNSATSLKCIGSFTANGNITADGGYLYAITNGNTVQIGSQSTGFCHITNSANISFYFNKSVHVDGSIYIYNSTHHLDSTAIYASRWRTPNLELAEVDANRMGLCNYGQATAKGLNVGNLLVSNSWADSSKVPTNGIYCKGVATFASNVDASGSITAANNIGIYNNGNQGGSNKGISLYNGPNNVLSYGILFELTSSLGQHYTCNGDWATYFTMDGNTNRGWIFRHVAYGNVASINGTGCMSLGYHSGSFSSAHRLCLVPPYHTGGPWYIDTYDPNGSYAFCDFLYGTSHIFQIRHDGHVWASAAFHNAVWNDVGECRKSDTHEYGRVINPEGNITTDRMESGARIISDTYGFLLGNDQDNNLAPVAIAGRVLAYPQKDISQYKIGDAVCSAPGGTVDIMTREEIKEYPDRIIGIVNEIPDYDIWEPSREEGGREPIHTNGRIWIDVR